MVVWSRILQAAFGDLVTYAYTKGSAVKSWDSDIDYVPTISDVDIHYATHNNAKILGGVHPFQSHMRVSAKYEQDFLQAMPNPPHIPRIQLVSLNALSELPEYVPPQIAPTRILFGAPHQDEIPPADRIRAIDLRSLLDLESVLNGLPMSVVDRVGIDFYVVIPSHQLESCPFSCKTPQSDGL